MPRKKKVSGCSHLRPLRFVNSPVFQPAPVLTPTVAVDNPVTAKTVAIEDLTESMWVSPQFRNIPGHQCRCQGANCFHHCTSPHLRQKSSRSGSEGAGQSKCKFRPLLFLKSAGTVMTVKGEMSTSHPEITKFADQGNKDCDCNDENSAIHLPSSINQEIEIVAEIATPKLIDINECDETPPPPPPNCATNDDYALDDQTLVAHLFRENSNTDTRQCIPEKSSPVQSKICRGLLKPQNLFGQNIAAEKSPNLTIRVADTACNTTSPSVAGIFPNTGVDVLSGKIIERNIKKGEDFCFFDMSLPTKLTGRDLVLAMDTPECDYGLNFRQKQLKYGFRIKSKEQSALNR